MARAELGVLDPQDGDEPGDLQALGCGGNLGLLHQELLHPEAAGEQETELGGIGGITREGKRCRKRFPFPAGCWS